MYVYMYTYMYVHIYNVYIYICRYTDIDTLKIIKYYLSFQGIHDFEQARAGMAVAVDQYCDGWTNWLISS